MNGTGLQLRVLKTEKITVVCHFMHVKLNSRRGLVLAAEPDY